MAVSQTLSVGQNKVLNLLFFLKLHMKEGTNPKPAPICLVHAVIGWQ